MCKTPEEIEKKFGISYLPHLEFFKDVSLEKLKCKCISKLKQKKYNNFNKWTSSLFKDDFTRAHTISFEIKKVNPLVGYGAFSCDNIPQLTFVGEYTGVVRKRDKKTDNLNDFVFGYVVCQNDTPYVIDAEKKGNFTRFINHSYEPNVTSRWIIADDVCHVIFFSNKFICSGEQLTYDYGPYYWRKRPFPQFI